MIWTSISIYILTTYMRTQAALSQFLRHFKLHLRFPNHKIFSLFVSSSSNTLQTLFNNKKHLWPKERILKLININDDRGYNVKSEQFDGPSGKEKRKNIKHWMHLVLVEHIFIWNFMSQFIDALFLFMSFGKCASILLLLLLLLFWLWNSTRWSAICIWIDAGSPCSTSHHAYCAQWCNGKGTQYIFFCFVWKKEDWERVKNIDIRDNGHNSFRSGRKITKTLYFHRIIFCGLLVFFFKLSVVCMVAGHNPRFNLF